MSTGDHSPWQRPPPTATSPAHSDTGRSDPIGESSGGKSNSNEPIVSPWARPVSNPKYSPTANTTEASPPREEPDRQAERQALLNVRGLVEKLQDQQASRDALERKALRWAGIFIVGVVLLYAASILLSVLAK